MINGLSIGSGGGYTVARELSLGIAGARPEWRITVVLTRGYSLHQEFGREELPANVDLHWAPSHTRGRLARGWYERVYLCRWASRSGVRAIIMLNGQTLAGCAIPVLSHNQDPWPYRPEAWGGFSDRLIALVKRREHRRGMGSAQVYGWTSQYLRDVVCSWQGMRPTTDAVFYNGLPTSWIERARSGASIPLAERPLQLVTVSNVTPYKRHGLVVRAVAALKRLPGLESVSYRVLGHGPPEQLAAIRRLAEDLGIQDAVFVEGRVTAERVVQAMAESRAFVMMSVCESFGLPAIEAMTFGTPVVVSDCCAHGEVCQGAAALVREDDLDHLIETLRWVIQDSDKAGSLAARGRRRAEDFQWSSTVEKMLHYIDQIVTGSSRAAG